MDLENADFFAGEFHHKLDAKNRLTIPADWRFEADGKNIYLAIPSKRGCITIYPPAQVKKIIAAASQSTLSDPKKSKVLSDLGRYSSKVSCDKTGRISLESRLLAHADIKDEAILIGAFEKFHIWSPAKLAENDKQYSLSDEETLSVLAELGL